MAAPSVLHLVANFGTGQHGCPYDLANMAASVMVSATPCSHHDPIWFSPRKTCLLKRPCLAAGLFPCGSDCIVIVDRTTRGTGMRTGHLSINSHEVIMWCSAADKRPCSMSYQQKYLRQVWKKIYCKTLLQIWSPCWVGKNFSQQEKWPHFVLRLHVHAQN